MTSVVSGVLWWQGGVGADVPGARQKRVGGIGGGVDAPPPLQLLALHCRVLLHAHAEPTHPFLSADRELVRGVAMHCPALLTGQAAALVRLFASEDTDAAGFAASAIAAAAASGAGMQAAPEDYAQVRASWKSLESLGEGVLPSTGGQALPRTLASSA